MPAPLYLCLYLCDFAVQTLVRLRPEMRQRPVAVLDGIPPLETVFALNDRARKLGLEFGMAKLQAESFSGVAVAKRVQREEDSAFLMLMQCAERFSPRIEVLASPGEKTSGATLVLDISASERLLGTPQEIAEGLQRKVHAAGLDPSIATSSNANAAVLAARGHPGITIVAPREEAQRLAPLPLSVLDLDAEQEETFASWGIKTLDALAALPQKALIARIGQAGYRLQALARGEHESLLVPAEAAADGVLNENMELEHPVDLLEPLLFLLSRMLDQILVRAAERALAIAGVETRLKLQGVLGKEHRRVVRPALPESSHATLLKLIQLDLEMHPPHAAVVALQMQGQPARPQTVQQGLFVPQTPEAGRLEVLLARLRKLVGEDRVGAAELLDSHRPDAFRMAGFLSHGNAQAAGGEIRTSALRMLRPPRAVRVEMQQARMIALSLDGRKLRVDKASGPWKASGAWWTHTEWCREEWDVALDTALQNQEKEQEKLYCRVAYDPGARCWYLTGIYD
jgi:protein ImuB